MAEGNGVATQLSDTNDKPTTMLEQAGWPKPLLGDVLGSKSATYLALSDLYGRSAVKVAGLEDKNAFAQFCEGKKRIIVKPDTGAHGQGVKLVEVTGGLGIQTIFDQLIEHGGAYLVEERIVAHPSMRSLNPSSINTVRITVERVEGEPVVRDCFLRVGRKGSFTDCAGEGALVIAIDPSAGELESAGIDESGKRYKWHPDSHCVFKKYRLPEWQNALDVAKQALITVEGLEFAGWDLALTSTDTWVVVDGNTVA